MITAKTTPAPNTRWTLQRRANLNCVKPRWRPFSYCTTRKAPIRLWYEKTGENSPVLNTLPKTINARALGDIQKASKLTPSNARGG